MTEKGIVAIFLTILAFLTFKISERLVQLELKVESLERSSHDPR